MKTRITWAAGSAAFLFVCFLLCRYTFLYLHGMKEWPLDLFIFGLIVILAAAIFDYRIAMLCAAAGYICGFVFGMLFNSYGVDQGGGRTNNAWIIWTVSFIVIILIGAVWDIVRKHVKKR